MPRGGKRVGAGRPATGAKQVASFTLSNEARAKLEEIAERQGTSKSAVLESAINTAFDKHQENKMQGLLMGDGTANSPYYIRGFRNEEFRKIGDGFEICEREGINRLNIAYSGRYYEHRKDGWYETSDTETCDKVHSLPTEGRKVNA